MRFTLCLCLVTCTLGIRSDLLDQEAGQTLQEESQEFGNAQTDVERDDEKSIRSFDWIGYTNALQIHKNGAIESFPTPFLSIPGKSQNSPCKVMMYKSAYSSLIEPVSALKANAVNGVKAELVELCKTELETFKDACTALDLHTDKGRWTALGKATDEVEDEETDETADEEDSQAENEVEAVEASNSAARDGVLNWVKVYTCMITEGKELSQSRSNLHLKYYFANAMKAGKRMMKFFKRKANKLASKLKGKTKPLLRLSKKLAGSRFCRAKSECKKWHSLLTAALGNQEILPESCQTFTRERGLVQIKGDPNERIGTIDLSSLDMGTASRKVTLVKSSSGELAFSVRNDLMSEVVSKVTLGTSVPKDYEAISGSWSNLIQTLEARSRQCKVDKVGVFNMQARFKANGFTLSERFPWKVIFFSSAAIEIHSKHAHGKSYGYDLHGDPEEIDFPCKWMTKAYERGLRPRRRLLPVADLSFLNYTFNFTHAGKFRKRTDRAVFGWLHNRTLHIPKKLYEPTSGGTMLWVDEQGKIPLPEWMRGMRKMSKLGKMAPSWMHSFSDGRSMADYVKYFKQDMRGLHAAQESLKILQALQDLGWKPDALVALNHGPENRLMEGQSESVQLSARMVNSVYPYNKKLASQPTISVDFWRHGGEQKLWSIYDYTESYLESCFTIEVTSLTQSNDGHSDPGDKIISSLALCTNNYAEPKSLPETSKRDRAEVMEELITFFSRGKPEEMQVSNTMTRSCYSESDCTGNTCVLPSDCKENEDSPCPVGFGCACDTSKVKTIFAVSLGASVVSEGTRNTLAFGSTFVAICKGVALAASPWTAGASLALFPLCPVLAPLFFYAIAPFGSDVFMAMIIASLLGGMQSCGCMPLTCSQSSRRKNNVCSLYHPQETEMSNEFHFVPPPEKKCVPSGYMGGCSMKKCDGAEMMETKLGWHAQKGKAYGRSVGIYNCKKGDFNASDLAVTSAFDYKAFVKEHPDWPELNDNLVPQLQAPAKLSMIELYTVGLPQDMQDCLKGRKGFMCRVKARVSFALNFIMALMEKLVDFLINVVIGALKFVRFTLFTVMSVVHKDLAGGRRWGGKCNFAAGPPMLEGDGAGEGAELSPNISAVGGAGSALELFDDLTMEMEHLGHIQDRLGDGSFCFQGSEFRPCEEVDLSEHYIS